MMFLFINSQFRLKAPTVGASGLTAMDGGNAGFARSKNLPFRPNLTVKPLPFASRYRLIPTWF